MISAATLSRTVSTKCIPFSHITRPPPYFGPVTLLSGDVFTRSECPLPTSARGLTERVPAPQPLSPPFAYDVMTLPGPIDTPHRHHGHNRHLQLHSRHTRLFRPARPATRTIRLRANARPLLFLGLHHIAYTIGLPTYRHHPPTMTSENCLHQYLFYFRWTVCHDVELLTRYVTSEMT